ncbi:MAG: hypothetical protein M3354_06715 [Chloroflexota bacterium]|nr:hypothetical protein [Chloroflexota bacterium]
MSTTSNKQRARAIDDQATVGGLVEAPSTATPIEPPPVPLAWAGLRHLGAAAGAVLLAHPAIAIVMALYLLAARIVPVMTPTAVGDDWVYARSVEILLREGDLRILDLSVVTLVFQVVWGALFALILGESFGALRLSTVVLVGLSGLACYGLCRELSITRSRAALGAAVYLFNPLTFVLTYSFMSDANFTALLVIASWGYVRGVRSGPTRAAGKWALLGGSVGASCAFLVRQQGAFIPFAVVFGLLLAGRLRFDRASVALVLRIAAIPVVAVFAYYYWLIEINGVPHWQTSFVQNIQAAGWDASWLLIRRMTFIEMAYIGLFVLPIVVAAIFSFGRLVRIRSPLGVLLFTAWTVAVITGVRYFDALGVAPPPMPRMPYIPQYVGSSGLGPADLMGGRQWIIGWTALDRITAISAIASILFAMSLSRQVRWGRLTDPGTTGGIIMISIAVWQTVGVWPPSFHFRDWIVSVDRYLLPIVPLAVCIALWALRDLRLVMPLAWLTMALYGVIAVAGTRDFLVFQDATWKLAQQTVEEGVPMTHLDAGAAWDGYYLWELSQGMGIPPQTANGPWWTSLFAPATDSTYLISSTPIFGYDVVRQVIYSSWLDPEPTVLYLSRRHAPPPPP